MTTNTNIKETVGSCKQNPLRVGVFGGFGAGRSGLVVRVLQNVYIGDITYEPTIEDSFDCVLGDTYLDLIDASEADTYVGMNQAFARHSHAALLLVDTTNESSLDDAKQFVKVFAEARDPARNPLPLVVVGTKIDLESERKLTPEEVKAFADTLSAPYIETSAKTGEGVREAFEEAAKIAINNNSVALEGHKNKRCAIQ